MKKLFNVTLALLFAVTSFGSIGVSANEKGSEDEAYVELDPVTYDEFLYGDKVNVEYVIYDEARGIDNIEEHMNRNRTVRGAIPPEDIADYRKFFSSVSWINRGGVISLSVNYNNAIFSAKERSWNVLLMAHYNDYYWNNARNSNPSANNSMYHQYTCHVDFAGSLKKPYNLEPYTADKGYWGFVGNACN